MQGIEPTVHVLENILIMKSATFLFNMYSAITVLQFDISLSINNIDQKSIFNKYYSQFQYDNQ